MLGVTALMLLMGFTLPSQTRSPSSHTEKRFISPIAFYGYQRGPSSVIGVSHSLATVASAKLDCQPRLTVRVHNAYLVNDEGSDRQAKESRTLECTEFMRSKCLDQQSCAVSVSDCRKVARAPPTQGNKMIVQYSCEPSENPPPLNNGELFIEGVSRSFLLVPGGDSVADANQNSMQLKKSLGRCWRSNTCRYVTCSDGGLHTDEYFEGDHAGQCAFLKPDHFRLPGHTVYMNYTGICSRPKQLKTKDFYEVAKLAKSNVPMSFTVAYQPTSQFNISPKHTSWICRGIPTIIPMAGHVVAVPASTR